MIRKNNSSRSSGDRNRPSRSEGSSRFGKSSTGRSPRRNDSAPSGRPFKQDRPRFDRSERDDRPAFDKSERPQRTERPPFNSDRPQRSERPFNSDRPQRSERPFNRERPQRSERPFNSERPQRSERPFNSERPQRSERPFNSDRPQRSERPFNSDRPQRSERPFNSERPQRSERPFNSDRPQRSERPFNSDRPQRSERPFNSDRPQRSERPFNSDRPQRSERPFNSDRPQRSERPFNSDRPQRSERPFNSDRPQRSERPFNSDRPQRSERPFNSERPQRSERPFNSERPAFKKDKPDEERRQPRLKSGESRFLNEKPIFKPKVEKTIWDNDDMRLNRFVALSGIAARRKADELIKNGNVSVNGTVIQEPGFRVKEADIVHLDGKQIAPELKKVYILMNKPKGAITTVSDERGRKTVMDIIGRNVRERIFPVGRLDRDTTGLLLLTNDGDLSQKMAHPSYRIKKVYQVGLNKPLITEHLKTIVAGIELEDGIAQVDTIEYVEGTGKLELVLEIHIGKNRIVRRIFEHLGYEVEKLDRVYYGGLTKKDLPRGTFRTLTEREVIMLKHFSGK